MRRGALQKMTSSATVNKRLERKKKVEWLDRLHVVVYNIDKSKVPSKTKALNTEIRIVSTGRKVQNNQKANIPYLT